MQFLPLFMDDRLKGTVLLFPKTPCAIICSFGIFIEKKNRFVGGGASGD